jgi:cellulose synthase/poly-beta-1,6-N-acetylglucosamine synthase-like glycosyltransferase
MNPWAVRVAVSVFWTSAAIVLLATVIYPLAMHVAARLRRRAVRSGDVDASVSCVVAARDEAAALDARIENLLACDVPGGRLEVIVASDGSTDGTSDVVAAWAERTAGRVRLVALAPSRGKAEALNAGVAAARGDVVVFADARQQFAPDAIAVLLRSFADPEVGAVSGRLELRPEGAGAGEAVGLYWSFEGALRRAESASGSTIGCTGAIYAIRRTLWTPLPPGTVLDDVLVPMRILLAGHRVVVEPGARAFDVGGALRGREFARKVRTVAGNVQLLRLCPALVNPLRGPAAWRFIGHKLLPRVVLPWALAAAFVSAAVLPGAAYRMALTAQALVYGVGIAGIALERRGGPLLRAPAAFVTLNAAAMVGTIRYFTTEPERLWSGRRPRPSDAASRPGARDIPRRQRPSDVASRPGARA